MNFLLISNGKGRKTIVYHAFFVEYYYIWA